MANTCGYLCPKCEGRGFDEEGNECDWCTADTNSQEETISDEEWLKNVHEGTCCSDAGFRET